MPNEAYIIFKSKAPKHHIPVAPKAAGELSKADLHERMDAIMSEKPENKLFVERRGNWTREQSARAAIGQMTADAIDLKQRAGESLPDAQAAERAMVQVANIAENKKESK
jgi:hypothetical protein